MGFVKNRLDAFVAFKNKDFTWYWVGLLLSFNGMNMTNVARGWLVYTLTDSAFYLGLVTAGFGIPLLLFSLHAGALADRLRKRNVLLICRTGTGLVSLAVAVLITIDQIAVWHLMAASVVSGTFFVFYLPARQAFVRELVSDDALLNAVALNSIAMNISRIASPALAGVLMKWIGVGGVYWIITVSSALTIFTLFMIPAGQQAPAERRAVPILKDVAEGLRHVMEHRIILVLMLIAFVPFLTTMSYQMLLPVFAKSVFGSGETGLGLLMSATGVGALIGSATLASMGDVRHKGLWTIVSGMGLGAALFLFGLTRSMPLALTCLLMAGASGSVYMALNMTLLMGYTPQDLMGRVMSIYMMTFGLTPIATLIAGALAEVMGASLTVVFFGLFMILFLMIVFAMEPRLKKLN
jgi:MFS family permease